MMPVEQAKDCHGFFCSLFKFFPSMIFQVSFVLVYLIVFKDSVFLHMPYI
jgi:hypothetical protein